MLLKESSVRVFTHYSVSLCMVRYLMLTYFNLWTKYRGCSQIRYPTLSRMSSQLPVTSFHSSLTHVVSPQETYTGVHLILRSKLSRRNHLLCLPPSVPPTHLSLGIHSWSSDLFMPWSWHRQRSSSKAWAGWGIMGWHKDFSGHPSMLPLLSSLHISVHKAVPAHCCGVFALPVKEETPAYASEALKLYWDSNSVLRLLRWRRVPYARMQEEKIHYC